MSLIILARSFRLILGYEIVIKESQTGDDPHSHTTPEEDLLLIIIQGGWIIIHNHIVNFFAIDEVEKTDRISIDPGVNTLSIRRVLAMKTNKLGDSCGLIGLRLIWGEPRGINLGHSPSLSDLRLFTFLQIRRL